jgi:hypothetical protein
MDMRPVRERLAGLNRQIGLFYDERSAELSDEDDRAALAKAEELPDPKNLQEVGNSYDFRSPVNVVR